MKPIAIVGAETLLHPERGYFALGIKSHGPASNFLLPTGYDQVASVFRLREKKRQTVR